MRYQHRRRTGFTLVEMMVATALVMVIMLIISQAFASASKTFTTMRTAGYMQERLRGGINISKRDLASDHFGPPFGPGRGGPHLSDQRLDQPGYQPPRAGFFEIRQLPDPITKTSSVFEPTLNPLTDGDGLTSTRAINHGMRFTVRLPDGPASELFAAKYSVYFTRDPRANAYINEQDILYSRWAQVAYFLTRDPENRDTKGDGTGLPLLVLRRRVQVLPPQNVDLGPMPQAQAQQIINDCANYPNDVIQPFAIQTPSPGVFIVRFPGPESLNESVVNANSLRIPFTAHPTGDDIVMVDVLSMDIKAAWFNNPALNNMLVPAQPTVIPSPGSQIMATGNTDEPFCDLPPYPGYSSLQPGSGTTRRFDTGYQSDLIDWDSPAPQTTPGANGMYGFLTYQPSMNPVPLRINVRAIQIKLRVWDPRAEQARQATIVSEV